MMEKEKRASENYPPQSPNLRHCPHRTKDGANTRGEKAGCGPAHPPPETSRREVGGREPEPERGNLSPREGIPYQTSNKLPVSNQDFLRFWAVDIHWEGHSQRSAPQKLKHPAPWRQACPENRAAGTRVVIRRITPRERALTKNLVA